MYEVHVSDYGDTRRNGFGLTIDLLRSKFELLGLEVPVTSNSWANKRPNKNAVYKIFFGYKANMGESFFGIRQCKIW